MSFENWSIEELFARCTDYDDGSLSMDKEEFAALRRIIAELLPDAHAEDTYKHVCELYHAQEKRLFKLAQRLKGPSFDKYAHSPSQAIDVLEAAIFGEKPVIGTIDYAACEALYLGNIIPEADK